MRCHNTLNAFTNGISWKSKSPLIGHGKQIYSVYIGNKFVIPVQSPCTLDWRILRNSRYIWPCHILGYVHVLFINSISDFFFVNRYTSSTFMIPHLIKNDSVIILLEEYLRNTGYFLDFFYYQYKTFVTTW